MTSYIGPNSEKARSRALCEDGTSASLLLITKTPTALVYTPFSPPAAVRTVFRSRREYSLLWSAGET